MKRCTSCGVVKPLEEFHRRSDSRDGRTSACRVCGTERARERQARRRAEIGDEAYLAEMALRRRRHRAKPGGAERDRVYTRAQSAALWRLVDRHPEEFETLLTEERVARGLPAVPYERQTG